MVKTGEFQSVGMSELRGIDIDKLAKGFADEDIIFKRFVSNATTAAREIRWYQKRSGILSGATPVTIQNAAPGALPFILEEEWKRQTSHVRKFFVGSPIISMEDIKDSDPDVIAGNVRNLTRSIAYQVDTRIWDVLSENRVAVNINQVHCSGGVWIDSGGCNPIYDLLDAKHRIRAQGYNPEGASLLLNSTSHTNLISWLISNKGSSIPQFASQKIESGVVINILGLNVSVSENVTDKYGLVGNLARACTWKSFVPITARNIEEVGVGTCIRVWEEGEAILTDPKAVCLLSGCGATAIS